MGQDTEPEPEASSKYRPMSPIRGGWRSEEGQVQPLVLNSPTTIIRTCLKSFPPELLNVSTGIDSWNLKPSSTVVRTTEVPRVGSLLSPRKFVYGMSVSLSSTPYLGRNA
jgi:hypothetical protein